MTGAERIRAVLAGRRPDRVPICDAWWQTTLDRWRAEGLPADVSPEDHFEVDWHRVVPDYTLQFAAQVLSENETERRVVDANGVTQRHLKSPDGWVPQVEGHRIDSRAAFEAHREAFAFRESRISGALAAGYAAARAKERGVFFSAHGCFHGTWGKVGQVELLMLLLDDPEWATELFEAHTKLICALYDGCRRRGMVFEGAFIADDLGTTRSPMVSPALYDRLIRPHHQRLCEHFAADGLTTILHSDGNVAPLIPSFLAAGFRGLHPLECKAGLDVRELRRTYGERLILFGNIDARALAGTAEQVVAEVTAKVTAGMAGGGYLFHSDHSVPSDVSLSNYRLALATAREVGRYTAGRER